MPHATVAPAEALFERLRAGQVVVVVGSRLARAAGLPDWGGLLERAAARLSDAGEPAERIAEVRAGLRAGRSTLVAGYLKRRLGQDELDALVREALAETAAGPTDLHRWIAALPARGFVTCAPDDLLEQALAERDLGTRPVQVGSYRDAREIDPRRPFLLYAHGAAAQGGLLATPGDVVEALAQHAPYRALLAELYRGRSFLFLGFGAADLDFLLLVDRALVALLPTAKPHWGFLEEASALEADELRADFGLTLLPGDTVEAVAALVERCQREGVTLETATPDGDDDLQGWLDALARTPADPVALGALARIEERLRDARDWERLVELLLGKLGASAEPATRRGALREVARIFEHEIGDLAKAFTTTQALFRDDPSADDVADSLERLAGAAGLWRELVADAAEVVPTIADPRVAAERWTRLGRWYADRLGHADYAISSLEQALSIDPRHGDALVLLAELHKGRGQYQELTQVLGRLAETAEDPDARRDHLLALGDACEVHVGDFPRAVDAYKRALDEDPTCELALVSLERIYRRAELWEELVVTLERRAARATDPAQAASLRRELAQVLTERLGDVGGAIARYEADLPRGGAAEETALRALEHLYERAGRTEEYLHVLERLVEVTADAADRARARRRLAMELEERPGGGRARAIEQLERICDDGQAADDVYRHLERLYEAQADWDALLRTLERHAEAAPAAARAELGARAGKIHELELNDPHRAARAYEAVVAQSPQHREALEALARLYERLEEWERAVATHLQLAEIVGEQKAAVDRWYRAGLIAGRDLAEDATAEARFAKALELEPAHLPSMNALVDLYRRRGDFLRAARMMVEAEGHSRNALEKTRLLYEAGALYEDHLDNDARAAELYARALALDPEHVDAGWRLARRLRAEARFGELEPVLEMLVRRAERDHSAQAGLYELHAECAAALGDGDKALRAWRRAYERDAESLVALRGLAALLYERGATGEAAARYEELLAKHRGGLDEAAVVEALYRLGSIAHAGGEPDRARAAWTDGRTIDPGHRATLEAVVALEAEAGRFHEVIDAKRALLEGSDDADERYRLYEEIGDAYLQHLEDPPRALGAYLEALKVKPKSRVLLNKCLDVYTEQKQWRRAVEMVSRLAELEPDRARRAKYSYAAAVICRDELGMIDEAIETFHASLEDAPGDERTIDAIERAHREREDWKGLAKSLRRILKRLPADGHDGLKVRLWHALGEVNRDRLADRESALAAFEVAAGLDRSNVGRHEMLADLYVEAGPAHADKAIAEHQVLLRHQPDRLGSYRALSRLYVGTGQVDKAWCLASALVFLKKAEAEEVERFEALRPRGFVPAKRRVTEELWQKAIAHPDEDRLIGGIFASIAAALASTTAQPHQAYGLKRKDAVDVAKDDRPLAKALRYAVQTLGLAAPELYVRPEPQPAISLANVGDKGALAAALVANAPVERRSERELVFEIAKRLAFLRPERYPRWALPTTPGLQAAFQGALLAAGAATRPPGDGVDADKVAQHLKRAVAQPALEQVAHLAKKLVAARPGLAHGEELSLVPWLAASDLTANRVGFILCNDFEAAARMISTEPTTQSPLKAMDRLKDLLAYSVSEEYFTVRKHLGIEVG